MDRRDFLSTVAGTAGVAALPGPLVADVAPQAPAGALRAVTIPAPDLPAIERAYAHFLGYRTVWRGTVPRTTALSWEAPAVAGRRALVMVPESGHPTYLRFVEQALPTGYRPLTTFGWNAAELLVQDPDALADRLRHSPFRIIGEPKFLPGFPGCKAMQAIGPAQEVLFFTHFAPDPKRPSRSGQPQSFVDHAFIGVVGVADLPRAVDGYERLFATRSYGTFGMTNAIFNDANHLPADTLFHLSSIPLAQGTMIEVDLMPSVATPRAVPAGGLAPGIALMSFDHGDIDRAGVAGVGGTTGAALLPGAERATRIVRGSGGELIELLQI